MLGRQRDDALFCFLSAYITIVQLAEMHQLLTLLLDSPGDDLVTLISHHSCWNNKHTGPPYSRTEIYEVRKSRSSSSYRSISAEPAPDLSSKPASCRCCCLSTGQTNGRTDIRPFYNASCILYGPHTYTRRHQIIKYIMTNLTSHTFTYHHHEYRNPGGSPNVIFFSHRIWNTWNI